MLILGIFNSLKEVKMIKKQSDTKNNIPEGVWILSVVLFAGALLCMLLSLAMFNYADQVADPLSAMSLQLAQMPDYGKMALTSPSTFVNFGLLFVVLALISYFIGRGILKLQNRARIALILVSILTLAMSIYALVKTTQIYSNVFTLAVNVVIIWYLFRKKTIKAFN